MVEEVEVSAGGRWKGDEGAGRRLTLFLRYWAQALLLLAISWHSCVSRLGAERKSRGRTET
jgi:hypothetical protein